MLLPRLSEADPLASSEGSIDPLGMYAIADSLAVRLVPGVRERMQRPRFVTAMAASAAICSDFGDDVLAADGRSEPWQVFEWYLVEGLVRACKDREAIRGVPGSEKASSAIRDGVPVSAARYLKTPSVYGYHGVYRLLAEDLGIVVGGRLGEAGCELLTVWMREQRLRGFWGTADGPGSRWEKSLLEAVADGLQKGAVSRKGGWRGWGFFRDHLVPAPAGRNEGRFLFDRLVGGPDSFRGQVLRFLVSEEGRETWQEDEDERVKVSHDDTDSGYLRKDDDDDLQAHHKVAGSVEDLIDSLPTRLNADDKGGFYPEGWIQVEQLDDGEDEQLAIMHTLPGAEEYYFKFGGAGGEGQMWEYSLDALGHTRYTRGCGGSRRGPYVDPEP